FLTLFTISIIIWVLQAVNYLDLVIEDGHGFLVYFNYTLLSFPKIFSRIYPFAVFLAFSYILLKYEEKNELVIFWNFGIKKIHFINFFIKFSLIFVFLSLLLGAFIAPYTQDKARSFIRMSDLDFFESILKPKKFIGVVKNLTIYYDNKNKNGDLENIFLNDKSDSANSQTIFAKKGIFEISGDKKILVLHDGTTINNINGKISKFTFDKTDFNISKFSSTTTTHQKIQETATTELVRCLLVLGGKKINFDNAEIKNINNCMPENLKNIYEELYSRLIKPMYITFLITLSLLLILRSKNDHTFKSYKYKIYFLGFLFIIFLESSSKFMSTNLLKNLSVSALPIFLVIIIYFYFLQNLKVNRK
ncbi:MAG: LptF/LptG family permease, partial [Candidatus Pelagibacter sp.]|nr:LptF/LptG family permease [Candidatus Pelagibacter sp.]